MSIFFGTDGIRGIVGQELNFDIAYKCGNSLSQIIKKKGRVLIGRDTRTSGSYLVNSITAGLLAGGVDVVDVGIIPTAGVSYLTSKCGFDYGIVITASHNPKEYNGIKILTSLGEKLPDNEEENLERRFMRNVYMPSDGIGRYCYKPGLINKYIEFLVSSSEFDFENLKVVIDASNGASYKVAPKVFRRLGAKVFKLNCLNDGDNINNNCGALYPNKLIKKVKEVNADIGFAFDGDADRIIAVDDKGQLVDGDKIVAILAKYLKMQGKLKNSAVVGTSQTNMGIENHLKERGIEFYRADVGDKYVISLMNKHDISLGGEQSGHVIIKNYLGTGDGVLTAVQLTNAVKVKNKKLSQLSNIKLYPQTNINIDVKEKLRILGSEQLAVAISNAQQELAGNGRILVRASGTESKIRIMVEGLNEKTTNNLANYIKNKIEELEQMEK